MKGSSRKLLAVIAGLLALQAVAMLFKYWSDIGPDGRFGGDFISFWKAAQNVAEGRASAVYDAQAWREVLTSPGPRELSWFVYPPFALLGLLPLGGLAYGPAVAIWSVLPLPFYFMLIAWLVRRSRIVSVPNSTSTTSDLHLIAVMWAACLPLLSANLFTGQTGGIVAVLLMSAAVCWWDRPILSGIAIGLMTIKPQMGLLIPFALLASGQWRAIAAAAGTILVLAVVTTAWLGQGIWTDYLAMTRLFAELMGQGYAGIRKLAVGPYVSLLSVGLPAWLAGIVQVTVLAGVLAAVIRAFVASSGGSDAANDLRLSLLATGTLLATPYALSYDMPLLALAIVPVGVRIWDQGCELWELVALAALLAVPYVQPVAVGAGVPFALLATVLWFVVIHLRLARETAPVAGSIRASHG